LTSGALGWFGKVEQYLQNINPYMKAFVVILEARRNKGFGPANSKESAKSEGTDVRAVIDFKPAKGAQKKGKRKLKEKCCDKKLKTTQVAWQF